VQYFQWRKSRGSSEKFHGAVVDHVGHENTRTFREVAEVGDALKKLTPILGSGTKAKVALICDTDSRWALKDSQGPLKKKHYIDVILEHYKALVRQGVDVDVIDQTCELDRYSVVVAPMMYMIRPGAAERIEAFVRNGGTFVATCRTGCVDQDDLCFLGGFPGPLRNVLGIWIEETDGLWENERNGIRPPCGNVFACRDMCDIIHAETAQVLGTYTEDFYAGTPALTVNKLGEGRAYYIASRPEQAMLDGFYAKILPENGVEPLVANLPTGVQAASRENENGRFLFVMNFTGRPVSIELPAGEDMLTGAAVGGTTELPVYGVRIIRC